jgi:hypothetical protein
MRSLVVSLSVVAALSVGVCRHALAEDIHPGDDLHKVSDAKKPHTPNRVVIDPNTGVKKVRKLRRGEYLAPVEAPELNPNAAGLALVLLAGSALLYVDRRRMQRS